MISVTAFDYNSRVTHATKTEALPAISDRVSLSDRGPMTKLLC